MHENGRNQPDTRTPFERVFDALTNFEKRCRIAEADAFGEHIDVQQTVKDLQDKLAELQGRERQAIAKSPTSRIRIRELRERLKLLAQAHKLLTEQ